MFIPIIDSATKRPILTKIINIFFRDIKKFRKLFKQH